MFYFFFSKYYDKYICISCSVYRQADDNQDVNPSNALNGYPGWEKKNKNPI